MYGDNLKHFGNIAVIRAMKYFAELGYSVLLPLGDYQKYDLVVEKGERFFRVQCKATRRSNVHLTSSGHYGGKYLDAALNPLAIDYLWISFGDRDYLIPVSELKVRKHIGITKKHKQYLVTKTSSL